jgi:hypothetical protein
MFFCAGLEKGSFALAYPLSRQRVAGVAYREGKSDTPSESAFACS